MQSDNRGNVHTMKSFIVLASAVCPLSFKLPRDLSLEHCVQSSVQPLAVYFKPCHVSNDDYLVEVLMGDMLVAHEARNGRNFRELAMGPFFHSGSVEDGKPSTTALVSASSSTRCQWAGLTPDSLTR